MGRRERCPHCQQAPCMGGRGPGSCMSGSRGKVVPTPRSREEQDRGTDDTHPSDWEKLTEKDTKIGKVISYSCRGCGQVKVVIAPAEPSSETHQNRRRKRLWHGVRRRKSQRKSRRRNRLESQVAHLRIRTRSHVSPMTSAVSVALVVRADTDNEFLGGTVDPVCPQCETQGCWYSKDGKEEGTEIWLCENGHEFLVHIGTNGNKKKWWWQ